MRHLLPVTLFLSSWMPSAWAQDQAVQQPVIRQMRIGTSVSVPDRGRAYLGGVGKGAMGTNRYGGPLRSGTNSGREFSNSSMCVSVYIHDFEEMDQALLNVARSSHPRRDEKQLNSRAAHAWRSLESGRARR